MKKVRILSWNVNGIRAVYKKGFVEWIRSVDPDILCIQETKAREEQLPEDLKNIDDYQSYFCWGEKKGYSGTAIYTKEKPKNVSRKLGIEKFDNEGRILIAEYDAFTLFNIYFPNGKAREERLQYKMDFYKAFLDHVKKLKDKGKKIIICGDVNTAHKEIDLARQKSNEKTSGFLPEERAWIDELLANGFLDTLRIFNDKPEQYSWWDMITRARERNLVWRRDYFFISDNLKEQTMDAFIMPEVMGSDHCPIGLKISV